MALPKKPKTAPSAKSNKTALQDTHATRMKQLQSASDGQEPSTPTSEYQETKTLTDRHEQRMAWLYGEASRQSSNRAMMAKCEAFYDSKQYEHDDAQDLRDRGQNPIVYNEVKPTIDFLIGTERRTRVDFYVIAEDEGEEASEDAINKTKLIKYLEDVNMAPFERSHAANESFKAGLGWIEVGLRGDKTGVPLFIGAESWRNCLHDSRAKPDQSDARYFFRLKVVDLDIAEAIFPDKVAELRSVCQQGDSFSDLKQLHGISGLITGFDSFDNSIMESGQRQELSVMSPVDFYNARERVLLIECWSREPVRRKPGPEGLGDPVQFKIRVSIMTELDTLLEAWSPFKHDRFPFVPVWAYRFAGTGLPYSPIWPLLGPQEGLNHRMSRSLYEASANQMEVEKSAIAHDVMSLDELRDEANAPDGVLIFADGALSGGKARQRTNAQAAQQQLQLAEADRGTIRAISSVNEENRGLRSTATSRVAMDAKADRGSVGTAELFDMQLMARQMEGELVLSLCEQFVVQPMTVRVAGEGGAYQYTKINQPQDDGTYLNDISARRAHYVVGEQAWRQSYAEAAFTSLMEVLTQLASAAPNVVVALLDVVFDMHPNLPRKKAILERIRKVNGQTDPDGKMTPEQQQAVQEQQALAKKKFEAEMGQLIADIKKTNAQGAKFDADAMLVKVTALYESAQAAAVLAQSPALTPIADSILASAGYRDESGSPDTIGEGQPPVPSAPVARPPALQQADGAQAGIETARPDGAQPQLPPAAQGAMQ